MDSIILYLISIIQEQYKQICYLLLFICKYIPLKQWAFDDSHSPEYQKFKVDKLPTVYTPATFDYQLYIAYIEHRYGYLIKPVKRRSEADIPKDLVCPRCGAPHDYLYNNNGSKGQLMCKVCEELFNSDNIYKHTIELRCPYCGNILVPKKERKCFRIHKCINRKCFYYLANERKLPPGLKSEEKHKYKLHYIYREFTMDFFRMDLHSLPPSAASFSFKKFSPHILGLVLTYHVNLKLSTRQTSHALKEVHGIDISHTTVTSYGVSLWVAYYNFLRPHPHNYWNPLNEIDEFEKVSNMPAKWVILIRLGQQKILEIQKTSSSSENACS